MEFCGWPSGRSKVAPSPDSMTELISACQAGDRRAVGRLTSLVYDELRRLAKRYLRGEPPGRSLQTTALIHEAYLRLVDQTGTAWQNRSHFLGIASQMMRRILVDHARRRGALRRQPGQQVDLEEAMQVSSRRAAEIVALDDALAGLAKLDERKSKVVELRFFGGLSVEETAEVLRVSPGTVMRDWTLAKAWLRRELSRSDRDAT